MDFVKPEKCLSQAGNEFCFLFVQHVAQLLYWLSYPGTLIPVTALRTILTRIKSSTVKSSLIVYLHD
jgi:hypothetical protein